MKHLQRTINTVVDQLVRRYQPQKIILFGSAALGTATRDSDVDLLLIKETTDRPADRLHNVWYSLNSWDIPIDFFVYTPEEFRRAKQEKSVFVGDILREGKTLYEAA